MAHRDARGSPALAELSGTAALLELARVFKVRDLSSTLVLVSTSGGSGGDAGAHAFAESADGDPIDAAIVLGDLAEQAHPQALDRALVQRPRRRPDGAAAHARERGPARGRRAGGRLARDRPVGAARAPADRLRAGRGGARRPAGRAAPGLRRDAARARARRCRRTASTPSAARRCARSSPSTPASRARTRTACSPHEAGGIITVRRLLPDWAIRLLVGTLLLPPLLTAIDAFFGARRRRLPVLRWIGWVAAGDRAVPARLAVDPAARADRRDRRAARAGAARGAAAGGLADRGAGVGPARARARVARAAARARVRGCDLPATVSAGGAAAALGLVISVLAAVVWVFNPLAAALLVPAAHAWLFATAPGTSTSSRVRVFLVLIGLALPALMAVHYALALDLGPARPRLARVPDHRGRAHLAARRARALGARRLPVRGRRRRAHAPARGQAGRARADPHPRPARATPGRGRWAALSPR